MAGMSALPFRGFVGATMGGPPADCLPGGDNSVTPVHPATQRNLNPARCLGTGLRKQVVVSQCGASQVTNWSATLSEPSVAAVLAGGGGGGGG